MDDVETRLLLAAQATALGLLALPARSRVGLPARPLCRAGGAALLAGGGALALAGALALGADLRPLPHPRPGARLRTGGPYRLTRHPIYAGLLLAAAGRAAHSASPRHAAAAAALAAVLNRKAKIEEKLLSAVVDYEPYARRVPRWGAGPRT